MGSQHEEDDERHAEEGGDHQRHGFVDDQAGQYKPATDHQQCLEAPGGQPSLSVKRFHDCSPIFCIGEGILRTIASLSAATRCCHPC